MGAVESNLTLNQTPSVLRPLVLSNCAPRYDCYHRAFVGPPWKPSELCLPNQTPMRSFENVTRSFAPTSASSIATLSRSAMSKRRPSSSYSKPQLNSVQMQVNEAFAVRKIEGSIKASVGIMKDVNSLIRLPQYGATMRELSVELMKAGIIEEKVEDTLPEDVDLEE